MTQKLPQICTVILRIRIGKVVDLQYIFVVTSGSPSTLYRYSFGGWREGWAHSGGKGGRMGPGEGYEEA